MDTPDDVSGPINIGNPHEVAIGELAERVIAMTGSASRVQFLPSPPDDHRRRRPDIGKAERILNWQPTVPLVEGLRRKTGTFRQAWRGPRFRAARWPTSATLGKKNG